MLYYDFFLTFLFNYSIVMIEFQQHGLN